MDEQMKQRLIETLMVQTETYHTELMQAFILEEVDKIEGCAVSVDKENIYITKGTAETYPCIVAHTDTVHDMYMNFQIFETADGELFSMDCNKMSQVGIGGDDKVGVFIALEILRNVDVCKVAFFRDEEHGCLGSADAIMGWFKNVEFVLQCDRQGYKDFVRSIFYDELYDEAFASAITSTLIAYEKEECWDGGMTDVWQLTENGLEVCCANISCGYHYPHTDEEFVDIEEVFNTYNFVKELFDILAGHVWTCKRTANPYKTKKTRRGGSYSQSRTNYYMTGELDDFYDEDEFSDIPFATEVGDKVYLEDGDECPECGENDTLADKEWNMLHCFNCQKYTKQGDIADSLTDPYHEPIQGIDETDADAIEAAINDQINEDTIKRIESKKK